MADGTAPIAPTLPDIEDPLSDLVDAAMRTLPQSPFSDLIDKIEGDAYTLIDTVTRQDATPSQEPEDPDETPSLAPFFQQRRFDEAKAKSTRRSSLRAATAPLENEMDNWESATAQYELAIAQARTALLDANTAAWTTYTTKWNQDSKSRAANLWFELKGAVASAVLIYNGAAAAAGSALATEAGTLIAAYATFVGAVAQAEAQFQVDDATASQTFWQGVEGLLDAP